MTSTSKFSWGHGIVLAIICFISFIAYIVIGSINSEWQLVSDDYYAQEIKFQDKIDESERTQALAEPFRIDLTDQKTLQISFPQELINGEASIHFFRPSDSKLDLKFEEKVDQRLLGFNVSELKSGMWIVKISTKKADQQYYYEEKLMLK